MARDLSTLKFKQLIRHHSFKRCNISSLFEIKLGYNGEEIRMFVSSAYRITFALSVRFRLLGRSLIRIKNRTGMNLSQ
jgi:hypothetical protein